jgi:hypothetical protein
MFSRCVGPPNPPLALPGFESPNCSRRPWAGRSASGRWATLTGLRFYRRGTSAACSPNGTNDDLMSIKRIVTMAGQLAQIESSQSGYTRFTVRCSRAWKARQDTESLFDLSSEELALEPVLQPPALLVLDVPPRGRGEANASWRQVDRRSLRISAASTRRPAATSASDSRKAACRAARSSASSQSPGSNGRSSTSVPSGKSVGSSTTSRPARTRAFSVMKRNVTLVRSPNKPLERTGDGTVYFYRTFASAGRSTTARWTSYAVNDDSP